MSGEVIECVGESFMRRGSVRKEVVYTACCLCRAWLCPMGFGFAGPNVAISVGAHVCTLIFARLGVPVYMTK